MKLLMIAILPFFTGCALLSDNRLGEFDEDALAEARIAERLRIRSAIETRDVTLGMKPNQVRSAWGTPMDVQVAGHPDSGNQRWIYSEGLSLRYGTQPIRIVYFEDGKVAGWETR